MLFAASQVHCAERAIDREVVVAANVDAVWQAWTTTEGIKTFFAPDAHVELRVDGPFEIFINPYAAPGMKGADGMRIVGFQPKRVAAFELSPSSRFTSAGRNKSGSATTYCR